jgi:hypothetical protein
MLALTFGVAVLTTGAAFAQPTPNPATPAPETNVDVMQTGARGSAPAAPPAQPRTTTPPAAPAAPVAPAAPRREGQPVNIRIDVTITDSRAGVAGAKKTVSVVTADGEGGRIRSQANYVNIGDVPLNVDTEPSLIADGKIRVRVNLMYDLPAPREGATSDVSSGAGTLRKTSVQENLSLILENGKSVIAAQSADPVGDRQVTIEVKATVLR